MKGDEYACGLYGYDCPGGGTVCAAAAPQLLEGLSGLCDLFFGITLALAYRPVQYSTSVLRGSLARLG